MFCKFSKAIAKYLQQSRTEEYVDRVIFKDKMKSAFKSKIRLKIRIVRTLISTFGYKLRRLSNSRHRNSKDWKFSNVSNLSENRTLNS